VSAYPKSKLMSRGPLVCKTTGAGVAELPAAVHISHRLLGAPRLGRHRPLPRMRDADLRLYGFGHVVMGDMGCLFGNTELHSTCMDTLVSGVPVRESSKATRGITQEKVGGRTNNEKSGQCLEIRITKLH
jgi:hypothetical protein